MITNVSADDNKLPLSCLLCGECVAPSSIIDADTRAKSQSSLVCLHTIDFLKSVDQLSPIEMSTKWKIGWLTRCLELEYTQHVEPLAYIIIIIIWIFALHHSFLLQIDMEVHDLTKKNARSGRLITISIDTHEFIEIIQYNRN